MKMAINNLAGAKIDKRLIERIVRRFARIYKIKPTKELSIAFITDAEIKKLNRVYRRINRPTDVLSFAGEGDFWGELLIDYRQIKKQAKRFKHSAKQELIFILVHGLLHLVGFDDKTEKERLKMIKLGEDFLKKIKL